MSSYTNVISELYGDHSSSNLAAYIQGDKNWNKMTLSAGMRMEYFKIDDVQSNGKLFQKKFKYSFSACFLDWEEPIILLNILF